MNYVLIDNVTGNNMPTFYATELEANTAALALVNTYIGAGRIEDIGGKLLVCKAMLVAKSVGSTVRLLRPDIQVRPVGEIPTADLTLNGGEQ